MAVAHLLLRQVRFAGLGSQKIAGTPLSTMPRYLLLRPTNLLEQMKKPEVGQEQEGVRKNFGRDLRRLLCCR